MTVRASFLVLTTAGSSGSGLSITGSPEGKGLALESQICSKGRAVLMGLWSSVSCCPAELPFETHAPRHVHAHTPACCRRGFVGLLSSVCFGFCSVRFEPWATHLLGKRSTSKLQPKLGEGGVVLFLDTGSYCVDLDGLKSKGFLPWSSRR